MSNQQKINNKTNATINQEAKSGAGVVMGSPLISDENMLF
jgi:hypothetical protein